MEGYAYAALAEAIGDMPIMDTHEHLPGSNALRTRPTDFITEYLTHYLLRDMVSAGMPDDVFYTLTAHDPALPIEEKWRLARPWWDICRHTGYAQALDEAVRAIYGLPRIDTGTVNALEEGFQAGLQSDHYRTVLKNLSNIHLSVLDVDFYDDPMDGEYFVPAFRIDSLVSPRGEDFLHTLARKSAAAVNSFDDYLLAVEKYLQACARRGHIFKCGLAYRRPLAFAPGDKAAARTAFEAAVQQGAYPPAEAFENYMMHYVLQWLDDRGMVLQIHTGLLESNRSILRYSHPDSLNELFMQYRNITFDIFHMGYPYQGQLGALCKMFPNVYIDLCWAHIITPVGVRSALSEYLEMLPANKISGFGGDYCFVDGVYGHQAMARRNIARVLAQKVEEGLFTLPRAVQLAQMLLYGNPARILRLPTAT